jgi:hypothetical protein
MAKGEDPDPAKNEPGNILKTKPVTKNGGKWMFPANEN